MLFIFFKPLHTVSCHIAELLPHLWKTSDTLCLSVLDMSVTVGPADSSCPAASSRAVGRHHILLGPPQECERLACSQFVFAAWNHKLAAILCNLFARFIHVPLEF